MASPLPGAVEPVFSLESELVVEPSVSFALAAAVELVVAPVEAPVVELAWAEEPNLLSALLRTLDNPLPGAVETEVSLLLVPAVESEDSFALVAAELAAVPVPVEAPVVAPVVEPA